MLQNNKPEDLLKESGIIMPVHNALDYVKRSVEYLVTNYPEVPFVIVDDASAVETRDYLLSVEVRHPQVEVLHHSRQQLFTRTVNHGLRYMFDQHSPRFYFIINSDCDLKEGCLEQLALALDNDNVGLAGYTDSPQTGEEFTTKVEFPNFVTGHCFGTTAEILTKVGLLCETDNGGGPCVFPELSPYHGLAHIGSDRLLSYQIQKYGKDTVYVNYPGVEHQAGKSWNHDLGWLHTFQLDPLWKPSNVL